jgi:hypothetical protein
MWRAEPDSGTASLRNTAYAVARWGLYWDTLPLAAAKTVNGEMMGRRAERIFIN